jgi:hypothetical protein
VGVVFGLGRRPIRLKDADIKRLYKNSNVIYRPLISSGALGPMSSVALPWLKLLGSSAPGAIFWSRPPLPSMSFSAGSRFFDSRRFFVVSFAVFCHFASLAISAFPLATLYTEGDKFIFAMILKSPCWRS